MKMHRWPLFIIILVATFLRLYKLGVNPPSLYWDEASLGYNAYAILTTGHDEHGELLPMARFTAFGDYKPPGYIYVLIPVIALLGVNEFAIRFPSAVSGIALVLLTYVLTKKLTKDNITALISAALLSVSPWSLQLSRAAFEANLAAFFNLFGITLFLYSFKRRWLLPLSVISFVFAFYTFNANRIISPLILIVLSILFIKQVWVNKKGLVASVIIGALLIGPTIPYFMTRESRLRFEEVSIFTNLDIINKSNARIETMGNSWWSKLLHNRRVYYAKEFLSHYTDHFKGGYLFVYGDRNPRLSIQSVGELFWFELPLVLTGLFLLFRRKDKITLFILLWFFIAHIPAGVARETPHMLRTASAIPIYSIWGGIGAHFIVKLLSSKKTWLKVSIFTFSVLFIMGNLYYYFHQYYVHYPRDWSGEWQYGYKELVQEIKKYEDGYGIISITPALGRPYIYFLLYNEISPLEYVKIRKAERDWYGFWEISGFGKYDFTGNLPKETGTRVLVAGVAGTFEGRGRKFSEIRSPDGKTVFEIGEM